jgi:hypothetical protein
MFGHCVANPVSETSCATISVKLTTQMQGLLSRSPLHDLVFCVEEPCLLQPNYPGKAFWVKCWIMLLEA